MLVMALKCHIHQKKDFDLKGIRQKRHSSGQKRSAGKSVALFAKIINFSSFIEFIQLSLAVPPFIAC